MNARFVVLRWPPCHGELERAARARARRLGAAWRVLLDWRGVLILQAEDATQPQIFDHGGGVLFGWACPNSEARGAFAPGDDVAASARELTGAWWGSYVGVLIDRRHDAVHVVRSPDGAQACYFAVLEGVKIAFSDAADFVQLAPEAQPDLDYLATFLAYPRAAPPRTGLQGVEEVSPGAALVLTREHVNIETLWRPFGRASLADFHQGAGALRGAADQVTAALAQDAGKVLHRLSGGFDSSIVLGLLAAHMPAGAITCVHEYWAHAPEADERVLARAAARRHGVKLVELAMEPGGVDYARLNQAPFAARPSLAILSFGDCTARDGYAAIAADVLTSGQGGDHVFQRHRSALSAADAIGDGLAFDKLMEIMLDAARLSRRSIWGVAQSVLAQLWRRRPVGPDRVSAAVQVLRSPVPLAELHPWQIEAASARLSPGRALYVWHLVDALGYHDASPITLNRRVRPIILSQPVIEASLRIAPYTMVAGGRDRALARAAFADLAPDDISRRTQKGETTRYFSAVLAANRDWIADTLSNGLLGACALIDRTKLRAVATTDWREDSRAADALYSLIAAEAWLQKLNALKQAAAQDPLAA